MPLNPSSLQSALETLFAAPPPTALECAQAWADAVGTYAAAILPASLTVSAASSAMVAPLHTAFVSEDAAPGMDAAFMAFAVAVAAGQLPLFTGVPPTTPLGIATLFGIFQPTHAAAATAFSAKVDLWMKTGTAVLVLPPNGVIAWS